MISDDLVNSYHLLLCALDLVYGNALQCSNCKELVNPNFKGKFVNQRLLEKKKKTVGQFTFLHSVYSWELYTQYRFPSIREHKCFSQDSLS